MKTLNEKLIEHYQCFNSERFFLDEHDESQGFVSIVSSSISDTCPYKLCKSIARFVKKNIKAEKYPFIYVTAYAFKTSEL